MAGRLRPARETSGDFYDVLALPPRVSTNGAAAADGSLAPLQIAVGDVAGKGIAAALVMALARAALTAIAQTLMQAALRERSPAPAASLPRLASPDTPSPAMTLRLASGLLHRDVGRRDFVACSLAVVDPPLTPGASPRLRLANAAQAPPILCRAGGAEELVPPGERLPLGILPDPEYDELELPLQPGDVVLFASDGLAEAPAQLDPSAPDTPTACPAIPGVGAATAGVPAAVSGVLAPPQAAGELFGFDRLLASAAYWATRATDAEGVAAGVWADVNAWCGESSHHDDMTLLIMRLAAADQGNPDHDGDGPTRPVASDGLKL